MIGSRLATATLPLPNRNEVLVAKQTAVIDRLSGGRLTLGVSLGSRPDVYVPLTMRAAVEPAFGDGGFENRRSYWAYVFGRLRPGASAQYHQLRAKVKVSGAVLPPMLTKLRRSARLKTIRLSV